MTKFEAIRRLAQTSADSTGRPVAILDLGTHYLIREIPQVRQFNIQELVAIVQPGV